MSSLRRCALIVIVAILCLSSVAFAAPVISTATPNVGPSGTGTSTTIAGSGFGSAQGGSTVTFGGVTATATSWSDTSITATIPGGLAAGSVNLVVTVDSVASNAVSFTIIPSITNLSPISGAAGTVVTITGTSFGSSQGSSTVTFNGVLASPSSWSDSSIVVAVPIGATTGPVVVTVNGIATTGANFTVPTPPPHIDSVSPTAGSVGSTVVINGTNFGASPGDAKITGPNSILILAPVVTWSDTQVTITVPADAKTGSIRVATNGQLSNGKSFTVTPAITSLSPNSGPVGTVVTITGTTFGSTQGSSTVKFNGTTATPSSWSATSIQAAVPSGTTTGNVVVTVSGNASNGKLFTINTLASILVLPPNSAIASGATEQFTATGIFVDGSTQDLTSSVTWSSSATNVATISTSGLATSVAAGSTTIQATSGSISGSANLTVAAAGFSATGSMVAARSGQTTTLLPGGQVLIAGGSSVTNSGELYDPVAGTFSSTSNMVVSRSFHTATLLNNGLVLIAGGDNGVNGSNGAVSSAELYSPATHEFFSTGSMSTARESHTATLLSNGKVLIAGGFIGFPGVGPFVTAAAEIYDPATGTFTPTASMNHPRYTHTATLLSNGKVLIAGGQSENVSGIANAELYDPATGTFSFTGTMVTPRSGQTATLLNNGTVLLAGGTASDSSKTAAAELYNPATGTFTATGSMTVARDSLAATLLNNGTVLVAGGFNTALLPAGEIYDPVAATFSSTGNMVTPRDPAAATLLASGQVLIVGGGTVNSELFQASTLVPSDLVSISLAPLSPTLAPGLSQHFVATGTMTGSSTQTLASATWNSFNNAAVTLTNDPSNQGTALPQGAGTAIVSACTGSICGLTTATVSSSVNLTSVFPGVGTYGTTVRIVGGGFGTSQGTSTVTFNGLAAAPSAWTPTMIVVPVPNGATTGNVVVTVSGTASNALPFTVVLPPAITGISPSAGSNGTPVTLTGANFGSSQGTSTVTFNGVLAVPTAWSDGSITVPVPQGASTGTIVVTLVGSVQSNGVAFSVPAPFISTVSPASGPIGQWLTLTGSNFGSAQGTSGITFSSIGTVAASWSDTSITVQVPPAATSGPILINVPGAGTSNSITFFVNVGLTGVNPSSGAAGTKVTLSGSGFGTPQGASTISFNGVAAAPTSWNIQAIIVPVPAGATSGPVSVTVGGTTSNTLNFTVAPGITSLSPAAGPAGTAVTIAGSAFGSTQGSSAVTFNGIPATVSSWNPSSITAAVPNGATTGLVTVTVGNSSSNGLSFSVTPAISSLSPASGPTGTAVTVVGSGFSAPQGTSTISFGGVTSTPTLWTPTRIVVPVPAGAVTGSVVVTVAGQASNGPTFTVGTGGIGGTITRASDGTAVSGALVEALQSNAVRASATTDSAGSYGISNLLPGTYDVRISASGLATTILAGNSVPATGPITVNAALDSPGTISGAVTKSDGVTPLSGASVVASLGLDSAGSATTDGSGAYTIANLGTGSYNVQASASGYTAQSQTGVSVTAGNTTPANFSLAGQSTITYDYDELGRLRGVVDSLNGAATYSYDPVGNILSIARITAGQVSIIDFTPKSAPVGATVTISGTGFSSTPGQNTVTFNGVAATVTAATSTQLVTAVPVSATTGAISVTTPAGSATSSSAFTVTPAGIGAPTITGFAPNIGVPGTTVTISGTNFDTVVNDRLKLNTTVARITSATSTTINAIVPIIGSGRFTLETPQGTAISSGDFFIPPPYGTVVFSASDIGFTGRMSQGVPFTASINTAGQIGLVVFDGTAGQTVTLQVTADTMVGPHAAAIVSLYDPTGMEGAAPPFLPHVLASTNFFVSSPTGLVGTVTLPITGTYTIMVNANGNTGSMTLALN